MNLSRHAILSISLLSMCAFSVLFGAELLLVPPSRLHIRRDTKPLTFDIEMPDYHHGTRDEWIEDARVLYHSIQSIADESIYNVADPRLDFDQKMRALTIVQQFNPELTAEKLLVIIDLEDQRGVISGEVPRGRYPVVTVLKAYGRPVSQKVMAALAKTTNEKRRELMCDVLQHVLSGTPDAIGHLREYAKGNGLKPEQKQNLQAAIELLQQPDRK